MESNTFYGDFLVKSVQATLSHQKSISVPRTTFTRFLVKHGLFLCLIAFPGG